MDIVDELERALARTGRTVAGTRPDQLGLRTPCPDWDVRALLNHIVGVNVFFGALVGGEGMPFQPGGAPPELIGDDYVGAYDRSVHVALDAYRAHGALQRVVHAPIGDLPGNVAVGINLVDNLGHGWDLARATDQDASIDDDLAEFALALAHQVVRDEFRNGQAFGAVVPVPEDAPMTDRLVAFLGRHP